MAFSFLPRDDTFFDLFDQLASKALEAARALEETFERWDRLDERIRNINSYEHACDDITQRSFEQLNSTFITPLAPAYIHTLVTRLDEFPRHIDFLFER